MAKRLFILSLSFPTMLFWALFWLMNGLDKFFCNSSFGLFTWFGKDRQGQFSTYMDRLDLSEGWIQPILIFAGIWEIAVAVVCIMATIAIAKGAALQQRMQTTTLALQLSVITFIGFCVFDVVAGDRAELLEHSTYIGVVIVSYMVTALEPVFAQLISEQRAEKA